MNIRSLATGLGLFASVFISPTNSSLHAAEIVCFAAASLTDSLKEIAADYAKETGEKVVFNFGASSFLARQIEEGAPADIFFSSDQSREEGLEKQGLHTKE